jgi:RNA polymerase sigma factor (sigma-70 family)
MNERQSDFERLRAFSRAGDQNAFRELVRSHLNLVFSTALRNTGDAGAAEEIAQNVFSALARRAWTFSPDDSLPAWLYKTALLESKMWIRGDFRRRRRENTAAELGTTMNSPNDRPAFHALVPLLDDALLSLRDQDRLALLLRYYEKQSLRDVGAALGVSEDTAQKRVAAALERVGDFFRRRGFRTASAAAAAALQHTAATASAGILASVTAAALECAPPALTGVSAWLARLIALSRLQTAVICAVVSSGPVVWQFSEQHHANDQLALVTIRGHNQGSGHRLVHLLSNISGLSLNLLFFCLLHPDMQFSVAMRRGQSMLLLGAPPRIGSGVAMVSPA